MKKVFIASAIFLAFGLVLLIIYNVVFSEKTNYEADTEEQTRDENESVGIKKGITQLSDKGIVSATVRNEKYLYLLSAEGEIIQMTLDGSIQSTLYETGIIANDAFWAQGKDRVIIKDNRGEFHLIDYDKREKILLKKGLDNVAWTNLEDKIIYKYFNEETKERTLDVADPDGSNWRTVTALDDRFRDIKIFPIPQTSSVSFWSLPRNGEASPVNSVGLMGGEIKEIIESREGADYLWSPNGTSVLVSYVKNGQIVLAVYDAKKGETTDIKLATIVEKCAWGSNSETIYCAEPQDVSIERDSFDYYYGNNATNDRIWKINIINGKRENLLVESKVGTVYDVKKIFLSPSGDRVFFIEKTTNGLFVII